MFNLFRKENKAINTKEKAIELINSFNRQFPKGIETDDVENYLKKISMFKNFPLDYIEFLSNFNGLSYNGKSFLNILNEDITKNHDRLISLNLQEGNTNFRDFNPNNNLILLGSDSLSFVVYNIDKKAYEIIANDNLSFIEKEFSSIYDLILYWLK